MRLSSAAAVFSFIFVHFLAVCADTAERWKFVGRSETDTKWFIDAETLSHMPENIVSVWVRSVPDRPVNDRKAEKQTPGAVLKYIQEKYFGDYAYTEGLWEIDCPNAMFRILYFCAYATEGAVLFSSLAPDAEWSFIIRGSAGETLRKAVCRDP